MSNQWDTYAQIFDDGVGEGGDKLHTKLIHPLLFSFLGAFEKKRILDAGCGNGYLVKLLAERAGHVTGVDSSKKLLKLARARTRQFITINYKEADLTQILPFTSDWFDFVVANMVLQYIPKLTVFATEAARILNHNGGLIVIIDHPAHAMFLRAQELAGMRNNKFLTSGSYFAAEKRKKRSLWDKAELEYYHRITEDYINPFTPYFHLDTMTELTEDGEMPRILGLKWIKRKTKP